MNSQLIKGIIILLSSFLLTQSCKKTEITYKVTDEQFINILSDIHISESAAQHLSLSNRDSIVEVYLRQILEIHNVEAEIFKQDFIQLKKDPKKLKQIYEKVIALLNELKKEKKNEGI